MEAVRLREVDKDYRNHLQAFLNFKVKATKKSGKNKQRPVYENFVKFFNYDEAQRIAKSGGRTEKRSPRFEGLSRFLKGKKETNV